MIFCIIGVVALIDQSQYEVDENSGSLEVCVNIMGLLHRQIFLAISTQDITAKGRNKY